VHTHFWVSVSLGSSRPQLRAYCFASASRDRCGSLIVLEDGGTQLFDIKRCTLHNDVAQALSHYRMLPNLNSHARHLLALTLTDQPTSDLTSASLNLHTCRLAHYALLTTHVFDTLVLRTMRIPCGFDVCVSLRQLHDFGV
jgi:hypothetical protein